MSRFALRGMQKVEPQGCNRHRRRRLEASFGRCFTGHSAVELAESISVFRAALVPSAESPTDSCAPHLHLRLSRILSLPTFPALSPCQDTLRRNGNISLTSACITALRHALACPSSRIRGHRRRETDWRARQRALRRIGAPTGDACPVFPSTWWCASPTRSLPGGSNSTHGIHRGISTIAYNCRVSAASTPRPSRVRAIAIGHHKVAARDPGVQRPTLNSAIHSRAHPRHVSSTQRLTERSAVRV